MHYEAFVTLSVLDTPRNRRLLGDSHGSSLQVEVDLLTPRATAGGDPAVRDPGSVSEADAVLARCVRTVSLPYRSRLRRVWDFLWHTPLWLVGLRGDVRAYPVALRCFQGFVSDSAAQVSAIRVRLSQPGIALARMPEDADTDANGSHGGGWGLFGLVGRVCSGVVRWVTGSVGRSGSGYVSSGDAMISGSEVQIELRAMLHGLPWLLHTWFYTCLFAVAAAVAVAGTLSVFALCLAVRAKMHWPLGVFLPAVGPLAKPAFGLFDGTDAAAAGGKKWKNTRSAASGVPRRSRSQPANSSAATRLSTGYARVRAFLASVLPSPVLWLLHICCWPWRSAYRIVAIATDVISIIISTFSSDAPVAAAAAADSPSESSGSDRHRCAKEFTGEVPECGDPNGGGDQYNDEVPAAKSAPQAERYEGGASVPRVVTQHPSALDAVYEEEEEDEEEADDEAGDIPLSSSPHRRAHPALYRGQRQPRSWLPASQAPTQEPEQTAGLRQRLAVPRMPSPSQRSSQNQGPFTPPLPRSSSPLPNPTRRDAD
jgi:hypothetical protein